MNITVDQNLLAFAQKCSKSLPISLILLKTLRHFKVDSVLKFDAWLSYFSVEGFYQSTDFRKAFLKILNGIKYKIL